MEKKFVNVKILNANHIIKKKLKLPKDAHLGVQLYRSSFLYVPWYGFVFHNIIQAHILLMKIPKSTYKPKQVLNSCVTDYCPNVKIKS